MGVLELVLCVAWAIWKGALRRTAPRKLQRQSSIPFKRRCGVWLVIAATQAILTTLILSVRRMENCAAVTSTWSLRIAARTMGASKQTANAAASCLTARFLQATLLDVSSAARPCAAATCLAILHLSRNR